MFGDMMGMMDKLKAAQEKVEATKARMSTILIDESSQENMVKVTVTASREIKSIHIAPEALEDAEMAEDYLITTLNKALQRAEEIYEREVAAAAKDGMPSIPGMNL